MSERPDSFSPEQGEILAALRQGIIFHRYLIPKGHVEWFSRTDGKHLSDENMRQLAKEGLVTYNPAGTSVDSLNRVEVSLTRAGDDLGRQFKYSPPLPSSR